MSDNPFDPATEPPVIMPRGRLTPGQWAVTVTVTVIAILISMGWLYLVTHYGL